MKNKRLIPIILVMQIGLLFLASCQSSRIPYYNADGSVISDISVKEDGSGGLKVKMPRDTLWTAGDRVMLSITQPGIDLDISIYGSESDTPLSVHRISQTIGIDKAQGVLEAVIDIASPGAVEYISIKPVARSGGAADVSAQTDAQTSPEELQRSDLLSLKINPPEQGIVLDDYRIVLPEIMRYRQELRNPGREGNTVAIYQDVYIDHLLAGFDYLNYVPVLELDYEYARPEAGMPVTYDSIEDGHGDEGQIGDPDRPVARIDLIPGDSGSADIKSLELRLRPGRHSVYLYPETFDGDVNLIRFSHNSIYGRLRGLRLLSIPRKPANGDTYLTPLPIDLGQLDEYSPALWRNDSYELFRWSLFPTVLIFNFSDYRTQARYLKRLAFFVEKEGYRGRMLSNAELANLHGWNAHNYHPRDLAEFFNKAVSDDVELNPEELELRDLLVERGVLKLEGGSYAEGEGAMVAITSDPSQSDASRVLFLNHESLHGLFYNSPELRDMANQLWNGLSDDSREYIKAYFSYVGYDPSDEYLMVNEFQAYMLQQDVVNLRWYVQSRMSERIVRKYPNLRSFVDRTRVQAGQEFLEAGKTLQGLVYELHGVVAGDLFGLVSWPDNLP